MKAQKQYTIGHYCDRQGKDLYPIYYKRDDLPWQRLATAHHKTVAEQVVARLKAEDGVAEAPGMSANNQSTPANSNATEQKPNHRNLYEELVQNVLTNHPALTREEAEEMLKAFGA